MSDQRNLIIAIALSVAPPYVQPQITVLGDALRRNQVMFVLDCSSSMRFRHRFENSKRNRLRIATDVMSRMAIPEK